MSRAVAKLKEYVMGEEEPKKAEPEAPPPVTETPPPPPPLDEDHAVVNKKEEEKEGANKDVDGEKKSVIPVPQEKPSPAVVQKIADPPVEKNPEGPIDRDAVLARVETEKRLALIKAWEESEKTKAENKAYKKISSVGAWENSKRAAVEAELKKIEEKLEKKKAEYTEKMKNKAAEVHKAAEEKRAMVEANRREQFLKVEETAAKFRASGYVPKKLLGCFSR